MFRIKLTGMTRLIERVKAFELTINGIFGRDGEFHKTCAQDYADMLKTAIDQQHFPVSYKPLTEKWVARKGHDRFWIGLTGRIRGSIGIKKTSEGWFGGSIGVDYVQYPEAQRSLFESVLAQYRKGKYYENMNARMSYLGGLWGS